MKGESYTTEALVLSTLRYGDTSLIVRWLSPTIGRFSTMARGAHNPGSPFAGALDLFYKCDISYVRSSGSDLHVLKEVNVTEPHVQLRRDYLVLMTSHYFAQLVECITEAGEPLEEDYALLLKALRYLTENESSVRLIERFESRLLWLHGMGPTENQPVEEVLLNSHLDIPQSRVDLIRRLIAQDEEAE
ncbi:MAG TPA: DNA repair protein RecO [Candidatus Methylacidiphilales bacterium]|nr:DNA repair protein RecO [Candidatus Methylacidiphilales bacterium]